MATLTTNFNHQLNNHTVRAEIHVTTKQIGKKHPQHHEGERSYQHHDEVDGSLKLQQQQAKPQIFATANTFESFGHF